MKIQTITILLITLFFTVTLNAKDCDYESKTVNGEVTKRGKPIKMIDGNDTLYLQLTKRNKELSVIVMSLHNNFNLSNSDMTLKLDNDSTYRVKILKVGDDSKSFYSIFNSKSIDKEGFLFDFATKAITGLSFFDNIRKKIIFNSNFDETTTEEVSRVFNCLCKIEGE